MRSDRFVLERLLAICAYYIKNKQSDEISILGNILQQSYPWGFTYDNYLAHHSELREHCLIVKVWSGR